MDKTDKEERQKDIDKAIILVTEIGRLGKELIPIVEKYCYEGGEKERATAKYIDFLVRQLLVAASGGGKSNLNWSWGKVKVQWK